MIPSSPQLWRNHGRKVMRLICLALDLLREENDLDIKEVDLNRKLFFCILRANHILYDQGDGFDSIPSPDGSNFPVADDETRTAREDKRPDFQWPLYDHSEPDPMRSAKVFSIECKRLGKASSRTWVLNENYVVHGIFRFISPEHGYGKSVPSGAMIGYVQNMALAEILSEVNTKNNDASIPLIFLAGEGWVEGGVSRLEQTLDRPLVPPSPFDLKHVWVDLRKAP